MNMKLTINQLRRIIQEEAGRLGRVPSRSARRLRESSRSRGRRKTLREATRDPANLYSDLEEMPVGEVLQLTSFDFSGDGYPVTLFIEKLSASSVPTDEDDFEEEEATYKVTMDSYNEYSDDDEEPDPVEEVVEEEITADELIDMIGEFSY
jgi:hypothetical protein